MTNRSRARRLAGDLLLAAPRQAARRALRSGRVGPGATIVTVNWNSAEYLRALLVGVERYSPAGTRLVVVDNRSGDGSRSVVRRHGGARLVALPVNIGHWRALDLGFLLARTEYVVSLDVDAFPVADGWLERLLAPLGEGYEVSGTHVHAGAVHPCCLAMRLERFVAGGHTFAPPGAAPPGSPDAERAAVDDVGALISAREDRRYLFERTEVAGPGDVGSLWEGLVYHNFYSTRFASRRPPEDEERWVGINPDVVAEVWRAAVSRHLG